MKALLKAVLFGVAVNVAFANIGHALSISGGGGGSFNGGTVAGNIIVQKSAPNIQVDSTEAVTNGVQMDGLFMFSRNNYNAGDNLYNVLSGFSYNCKWDPSQNSGSGGWVKTLGGFPARGCWILGTGVAGDFILRYKANNTDATGTVYTDAVFSRKGELVDMSSGQMVLDGTVSMAGGVQVTTLGTYIPTFTDAGFNTIFRMDGTTGLPQWVNNGSAKPTCALATRGGVWYFPGGAGVKDTFEVCGKDAADAYAWRVIY